MRPVAQRAAFEAQIPTEVLRQDQSRSSVHHEDCAGKAALPVPPSRRLGTSAVDVIMSSVRWSMVAGRRLAMNSVHHGWVLRQQRMDRVHHFDRGSMAAAFDLRSAV